MLARRLRRRANNKPTLGQHLVFPEMCLDSIVIPDRPSDQRNSIQNFLALILRNICFAYYITLYIISHIIDRLGLCYSQNSTEYTNPQIIIKI